jgi:DNA polymerase III subunit epsilon
MDREKIIRDLERSGEYKIIRKFVKQDYYHADDCSEKFTGLFIDCETTGLDASSDKIIEIGIVEFEFGKDGRVFKIRNSHSAQEDPGISLSKKIVTLTGLTDEDLAKKSFDADVINEMVANADLIFAHHASFDRKFLEKRFPIFIEKAWACSQTQVPWADEGVNSSALEFLAFKFGFFYDAHRAETDCRAGLHILCQNLPKSGNSVLGVLLANARQDSKIVWAVGSGIDKKDLLKNRGYRWFPGGEGRKKSWYKEIDKENLELELEYLKKEIYKRDINLPIDNLTAFNRFSGRF